MITKAPDTINYFSEGVKIGLEFHQQILAPYTRDSLNVKHGGKLFCRCPALLRDDHPDFTVVRKLRAVSGETGDIDITAQFEKMKKGKTIYEGYHDTTCLIELDEEPIAPINPSALKRSLMMARKLFGLQLVDEIMVSRKTIIDGSNTSGFQRTALIAFEGSESFITVNGKRIGIYQANLEEDSAKNTGTEGSTRKFRLDRLGIPLIEIATSPDISTPEEGLEVAKHIGNLLRTTGFVKRGQGTIRQDLNVSISRGTRIEIKGVSELDLLPTYIRNECIRQTRMLDLVEELKKIGIGDRLKEFRAKDLTSIFKKCKAKFIKNAIKEKKKVIGTLVPGMDGLLGYELQPNYRVGSEFSEIVKVSAGAGGILHSDELPKFGITQEEVEKVKEKLAVKEDDGFILIVAKKETAKRGIESIKETIKLWLEAATLIPEVRAPRADGTTGFLRPLPGKARMYPETDSPPIHIYQLLGEIEAVEFEMPEERAKRYQNQLKLSSDLAEILSVHPQNVLFEELVAHSVDANLVANTLLSTMVNLRRDGLDIERILNEDLHDIFDLIAKKKISKDSIEKILIGRCNDQLSVTELVDKLDLVMLSEDEVAERIRQIVDENTDFLERGMAAMGPIMGKVMSVMKGKADGKLISNLVKKEIQSRL